MGHELFGRLYDFFVAEDYQQIPTDSDNVAMFAEGFDDTVYLVNVIELSATYAFNRKKYSVYRQLTKMQFSQVGASHIILLNILLIDNADRIYDEVNYLSEESDGFLDIHWIIDTRYNDLIIPKKQVHKVLDLESRLIELIKGKEGSYIAIRPRTKAPVISGAIILLNIVLWLVMVLKGIPMDYQGLISFGGLSLDSILEQGYYANIFTNMFIHISAIHLIFFSFCILVLGTKLERYVKWWQFLLIYIGSGLGGSLMTLGYRYFVPKEVITAGAYACVFGLIGGMLLCTKLTHRLFDGLHEYHLLFFLLAGGLFTYFSPQLLDKFPIIGGFISGILLTFLILYRRPAHAAE